MRTSITSTLFCLAATLGTASLFGPVAGAQESANSADKPGVIIEIVNQDGETVAQPKRMLARVQQEGETGNPKKSATFKVENKDGKIIIVDSEGNRRELDVNGAQSIVINKTAKSIEKDGKQETDVQGKVVIVGPDGKKEVIELGDDDMNLHFGEWNMAGPEGASVFRLRRNDNKFMIGVFCEPVSEALASQLRLASGTGLVVDNVTPDSPAAQAGIERHDILLFAEESELNNQQQLIEAVQEAGKGGASLTLTLLRGGKEMNVDVTPAERPEGELGNVLGLENGLRVFPMIDGKFDLKFDEMGPGIIVDRQFNDDLHERIEAQMKEMQKQMEELRQQMRLRLEGDQDQ